MPSATTQRKLHGAARLACRKRRLFAAAELARHLILIGQVGSCRAPRVLPAPVFNRPGLRSKRQ